MLFAVVVHCLHNIIVLQVTVRAKIKLPNIIILKLKMLIKKIYHLICFVCKYARLARKKYVANIYAFTVSVLVFLNQDTHSY